MQHIYNFEQMVLSNKGVVPITSLLYGDYVFDASTGDHIPVFGIKKLPLKELVKITYSDGRFMYNHYDQYIATHYTVGSSDNSDMYMARIEAFIKHPELIANGLTNINQYPVNLNSDDIYIEPVDPYYIAPFIVFGDLSDPYMNLPSFMSADINHWLDKNPKMRVTSYRSDKIHFGDNLCQLMDWNHGGMNIVNKLDFSVEGYLMKILYSGINYITRFIRAICDINVDRITMHDHDIVNIKLYITNPAIPIIAALIRDMITMLGVTCSVETMIWRKKRIYCIRILGGDMTKLFYDEDILAEILRFKHREPNSVSITNVEVIPEHEEFYQIIVDDKYHHRCYLSPNMLPVVINTN